MNKFILLIVLFSVFAGGPVSAQISSIAANAQRRVAEENEQNGQYQDAVQILHRNASTLEAKNLNAHMDTISQTCESRQLTEAITRNLLDMDLDLQVDIVSFDILPGGTDKMVKIDCVHVTAKVGGAARFVDNEMRAIHTLVKTEDGWKIEGSKILKIDMLYDE